MIVKIKAAACLCATMTVANAAAAVAQNAGSFPDPHLKPAITGLISMGQGGLVGDPNNPLYNENAAYGIPDSSLKDVIATQYAFSGIVINVPWVKIQPYGSSDFNTSDIEAALAQIRVYNAQVPSGRTLTAILRIWASQNAPGWVKALDGGPVTVYENVSRKGVNTVSPYAIGHFWAAGYKQAWQGLQSKLAATYDSEPLISQVSDASCTSVDDEPNALARTYDLASGLSSVGNLRQAGFTDTLYRACLVNSGADYAAWRRTPVNLPFGPVFDTDAYPGSQYQVDTAWPVTWVQEWKAAMGARGVLSNHNLSNPLSLRVAPVYDAIAQLGRPIEFQTHSPWNADVPGCAYVPGATPAPGCALDWAGTIDEAVCLGAQSVELWNDTNVGGYVQQAPNLQRWSHELKAGVPGVACSTLPGPTQP